MTKFSSISIIYNPNSTGDSRQNAETLSQEIKLNKAVKDTDVELIATQYAGHAEELAYKISKQHQRPLIISSSGDGGYHEVINGAIRGANASHRPVCAVLPSGNANDHRRSVKKRPLLESIISRKVSKIDVLKITITSGKSKQVRYAHSYIGLGLTPVVASELNRHTLGALKEMWIVIRSFYDLRPFKIKTVKGVVTFDSLIFSNINQMAKMLTLSEHGKPDDGKFEVTSFPSGSKLSLIFKLLKSATVGLRADMVTNEYTFKTIKGMPLQLDGEILELKKDSDVKVGIYSKGLETLL